VLRVFKIQLDTSKLVRRLTGLLLNHGLDGFLLVVVQIYGLEGMRLLEEGCKRALSCGSQLNSCSLESVSYSRFDAIKLIKASEAFRETESEAYVDD
jgi:hypothetical protein